MMPDLSSFSTADLLLELARREKRAEDDLELIRQAKGVKPRRVHAFDDILRDVATYYQLDPGAVLGGGKGAELVRARHAAMYLCSELTDRGRSEIAQFFDDIDPSTVVHAINKLSDEMEDMPNKKSELQELRAIITRGKAPSKGN